MQQKNPAQEFMDTMQSSMKTMMDGTPTANPFDIKSIMEAQRKSMQAITEANQRVMDNWQALARRQTEMVTQFVQDNSTMARDVLSTAASSPQESLSRQADMMKAVYEKTLLNTRELAEMMRQSSVETADIIKGGMSAGAAKAKKAE